MPGRQIDRDIEGKEVFVVDVLIIDHMEVLFIEVGWWNPDLIPRNYEPPYATHAVQVNYQEEGQLYQLKKRFKLLC